MSISEFAQSSVARNVAVRDVLQVLPFDLRKGNAGTGSMLGDKARMGVGPRSWSLVFFCLSNSIIDDW